MFAALRRRLLARVADPEWQAGAAMGLVGRFFARRQARALFDLCAGFTYSQTLVACEALGLIDAVAREPRSLSALAKQLDCPADRLQALLRSAVALKLLEETDAGYTPGMLGASLLGNPGVRAMVRHHRHLYRDLMDPEALVRDPAAGGALRQYWSYAGDFSGEHAADSAAALDYSVLMAQSQSFIARQALGAISLKPYRRLVDLGGGQGVFAAQALASGNLQSAAVVDLPGVIATVAEPAAAPGLEFIAGDLFSGPLPPADVYSLVRILHDHDDERVMTLLRRIRDALRGGGDLLIVEPLAGAGARRSSSAYFGLYFLAMGQGRLRSRGELHEMLRAAGFSRFRAIPTAVPQLVEILLVQVQTPDFTPDPASAAAPPSSSGFDVDVTKA